MSKLLLVMIWVFLENLGKSRRISEVGRCLQIVFGGRLQNAPTQHTLKVIDYLGNQLVI